MKYDGDDDFLRGRDERSRMINRQAELISTLNEENRKLRSQVLKLEGRVEQMEPYVHCYKTLQETVLKYPSLMVEWQRFCVLLKLCDPDEAKYRDHA
jgi:hypothetical protein